jgi:hypothetical protein
MVFGWGSESCPRGMVVTAMAEGSVLLSTSTWPTKEFKEEKKGRKNIGF